MLIVAAGFKSSEEADFLMVFYHFLLRTYNTVLVC